MSIWPLVVVAFVAYVVIRFFKTYDRNAVDSLWANYIYSVGNVDMEDDES